MENKCLRETIGFLTNDAKDFLKYLPLAPEEMEDNLEIVERWEASIVSYIEKLEQENAALKKGQAA